MEFTLDHEAPYFTNMRRRTSRKVRQGCPLEPFGACMIAPGCVPWLNACAPNLGLFRVPVAAIACLPACLKAHARLQVVPHLHVVLPVALRSVPQSVPQDSDLNGVVDVRYTGGARMLLLIEVGTGRWRIKIPVMVSGGLRLLRCVLCMLYVPCRAVSCCAMLCHATSVLRVWRLGVVASLSACGFAISSLFFGIRGAPHLDRGLLLIAHYTAAAGASPGPENRCRRPPPPRATPRWQVGRP
jgi:hypothetical protein